MIILKRKEVNEAKIQETEASENDSLNFALEVENREHENASLLKKQGFNGAVQGKPLDVVIHEYDTHFNQQIERLKGKISVQSQRLNEHLSTIKSRIDEEESGLSADVITNQELEIEKVSILEQIQVMETTLNNLNGELGNAHKNVIQNRIDEVKKELMEITNIFNEVSENKLKNEKEIKSSIAKHRILCEKLLNDFEKKHDIICGKLEDAFTLGSTRFSASFLFSIGLLGCVAAGISFGTFVADKTSETNAPSWVFFFLKNFFEFITQFVSMSGGIVATSSLISIYIVFLVFISFVIYICEKLLAKSTVDKVDIQLGVDLSEKEDRSFRMLLKTSSLLTFWLHIVPWALVFGILIILVGVGQALSDTPNQIDELGKFFSNQLIGSSIALVTGGVFFLYISRIVEPRKRLNEITGAQAEPKIKRKYFEIFALVIFGNSILFGIVIVRFGGFSSFQNGGAAVLPFLLLVNLAALLLGYGIQQLGWVQALQATQQKMFWLSNHLKALSDNKPMTLWISESIQFKEHFLRIQRELFELMEAKNKFLKMLGSKSIEAIVSDANGEKSNRWYHVNRWSRSDGSRKRLNAYYRLNFPQLSNKSEEIRNRLNEYKAKLKDVNDLILAIREKRSNLFRNIQENIKNLRISYNKYVGQRLQLEEDSILLFDKLEKERREAISMISEGHQLGLWANGEKNRYDEA